MSIPMRIYRPRPLIRVLQIEEQWWAPQHRTCTVLILKFFIEILKIHAGYDDKLSQTSLDWPDTRERKVRSLGQLNW